MLDKDCAAKLFARAASKARARTDAASPKAVRWVWSNGEWPEFSLWPFAEQLSQRRARLLTKEPKTKAHAIHGYAIDANDRVVIHEAYVSKGVCQRELRSYVKDRCEWTRYRHDGVLLRAGVAVLGKHGPTEMVSVDGHKHTRRHRWTYRGGHPTKVVEVNEPLQGAKYQTTLEARWSTDGELEQLTRTDSRTGRTHVEWPPGA